MPKRILMTVGGTGGHVYPAVALAEQLKAAMPGVEILFIGGKLESNRYFDPAAYPCKGTACGAVNTKNPFKLLKSVYSILKGILQSRSVIKNYRPDLVVGFGSYHTLPALIAAKLCRKPIVLHESNSIPGKVNRLISPYAVTTGILFPESARSLRGTTKEVGMPLRPGFKKGSVSKEAALAYFGLQPGKPALLIFGGSQGAQALNKLVMEALNGSFQFIHVAGTAASADNLRKAYQEKGLQGCVKDFESRMDLAWQAADLALCRAGAGTIAEALEFEVPCILIPYPYAADNHQERNAAFLVETIAGGIMLRERELSSAKLRDTLALLEEGRLEGMRKAIGAYKLKQRGDDFCALITSLVGQKV